MLQATVGAAASNVISFGWTLYDLNKFLTNIVRVISTIKEEHTSDFFIFKRPNMY